MYEDELVLCGELEEDLKVMVGQFGEVCWRRGPKVNVGEEGLEFEVYVHGIGFIWSMSWN